MHCILERKILIEIMSCHVGEVDYKLDNNQLVKDVTDPNLDFADIYIK